jgi:histidinol-phosphatase (PHP family)
MHYEDYADILDLILKQVVNDGKGIEINTSGYAYKLESSIPSLDIIKRYKELGGEFITMASDAHTVERVADKFDQAVQILKKAGFKRVTYFSNRKPFFQEI